MIDLHTHILPGLDDGPANVDFSLALATAMVDAGIEVAAATPHIRSDHAVEPLELPQRVDDFAARLDDAGVALEVVKGGEVDLARAMTLDRIELEAVCLGNSPFVLLESPRAPVGDSLESTLGELRGLGLRPILAHPERSEVFLSDPERLERLLATGALASVTASSMAGGFGRRVRRFTADLLRRGLVHDVASDAHDHIFRPPDMTDAFRRLDEQIPGLAAAADWFTRTSPAAILEGRDPGAPPPLSGGRSRLRRIATPLFFG